MLGSQEISDCFYVGWQALGYLQTQVNGSGRINTSDFPSPDFTPTESVRGRPELGAADSGYQGHEGWVSSGMCQE